MPPESSESAPPSEPAHLGHAYKPYIPASAHLAELGVVPLLAGTLLGVVFGASSLYLVL